VNAKGKLVGGKTWGYRPFLRYTATHALVGIPEAGYTYGRGWVELGVGCRSCPMRVLADVPSEQYLYGVAEVPSTWPVSALEAQAVAARTYALHKVAQFGQHQPGCDCGVLDTTEDQVYAGYDKETEPGGARWIAAIRRTRHVAVTFRGRLIEAQYSSSSGGHTESSAATWGTALPYLRAVCDPGDFTRANPLRAWSFSLSRRAVGDRISRATGDRLGAAVRFEHTRRTPGGRISQTTFVGKRGQATISGSTLASALDLRSTLVWIGGNRNVLSPLRARYDELNCRPGFATTVQIHVRGLVAQRFPDGALYRNKTRRATYWLHGRVYHAYRSRGEWAGSLGRPRSDVMRTRRAALARFDGGVLRCRRDGCRVTKA
jgi:SpoIID/LytB domain protein